MDGSGPKDKMNDCQEVRLYSRALLLSLYFSAPQHGFAMSGGSVVRNSSAQCRLGFDPRLGRSSGEGHGNQLSSILAWEIQAIASLTHWPYKNVYTYAHSHPPHSRESRCCCSSQAVSGWMMWWYRPGLQCRSGCNPPGAQGSEALTRALLTSQHPILLLLTESSHNSAAWQLRLGQWDQLPCLQLLTGTQAATSPAWSHLQSHPSCIKSSQFNQTDPSFLLEKEVAFFLTSSILFPFFVNLGAVDA